MMDPAPSPARRASRLLAAPLLLFLGAASGAGLSTGVLPAMGAEEPPPPVGSGVSLPEGWAVYREALDLIREQYVGAAELDDQALVEGSIRGLVDALGDTGHTVYLAPDEVQADAEALDGTVTGIGVTLDQRGGSPMVVSVLDGSPAERAGLRVGDLIIAVDGTRTDRSTTEDLVRLVRGDAGTAVELRIRDRDGATRDVSIVRERISVPPVAWAFVPGTRIALIRLAQFSDGAGREVADAAREALGADASALVLDLRGNPGGLLHEAVAVASTFLEDGVIYRSVDQGGEEDTVRTRGDAVVPDLPLAVLIDRGSASSAEIVAAALQQNDRARVVGESTFGTGTVLNIFPLSDGSAIRLGVQRWLTPDGESAFASGIAPDVEVTLPPDGIPLEPSDLEDLTRRDFAATSDTQLRRAVRLLRPAGA